MLLASFGRFQHAERGREEAGNASLYQQCLSSLQSLLKVHFCSIGVGNFLISHLISNSQKGLKIAVMLAGVSVFAASLITMSLRNKQARVSLLELSYSSDLLVALWCLYRIFELSSPTWLHKPAIKDKQSCPKPPSINYSHAGSLSNSIDLIEILQAQAVESSYESALIDRQDEIRSILKEAPSSSIAERMAQISQHQILAEPPIDATSAANSLEEAQPGIRGRRQTADGLEKENSQLPVVFQSTPICYEVANNVHVSGTAI